MSPSTPVVSFFVLLLVTVSVLGFDEKEREGEVRVRHRRELLACKRQGETCRGFPRCCGTLHCHWEGGYNPLRTGTCTACNGRDQICQTDSQCCDSMVCHKSTWLGIDGKCDTKRNNADACHTDEQCVSGYCDVSTVDLVRGNTGTCQQTPSKK